MSRGTIFGFIGGWFLVLMSMRLATDNFGLFADISSAVLVLGGSYVTMFICFEAKDVIGATKEILRLFKPHKDSERSYKNEVGRFVQWAYVTQKNGLQGLENEALTSVGNDDPFLRYGIELVISGYTGNEVRDILKEASFSEYQRIGKLTEVAKQLGANTPAFGMAGTLIGLIVMLGNMSGDPGAIGMGMAVALITTFYGILAQRALGWEIGHSWKSPAVAEPDMDAILKEKAGRRAVALIEIGQDEWAEKELVKLFAAKKNLRDNLLAYVDTLPEYPDLKERLAGLNGKIETPDGDNALYPVPNWTPVNGWQLDKALVYAFVRQESCFKNKAFSKAGARGVMQLMPGTARLMARKLGVKYQLSRLHKIPYSLMMGQELIKTLLNYPSIDGNLLMAIASYNCGPRNTKKWQKREDFKNDPLMFVEAIPSRETRGFVKKVASNYWIYRSLLGEDLSSVDDVLAGRYPVYKPE